MNRVSFLLRPHKRRHLSRGSSCPASALRARHAFLQARPPAARLMCATVPTAGDDAAADRSDPVEGSPIPESTTGATLSDPVAHGLRILLAEDDTMVARSTVAVLRRLGHTITHVHDGSSAWKCLREGIHEFDALLIDVVLPRMSGSDLAHRARAAGFAGRIVMVSGLVMAIDPDMIERLRIGAFMTKPFLPADLDRALRGRD